MTGATETEAQTPAAGPVVIAYDGSHLSQLAISEAGSLLAGGRDALVVCVWQPFDLGFVPVDASPFDAEETPSVRAAAGKTAAAGAVLAQTAGFHARSLEIEAAPIWKGIVDVAEEHDASAIVLGSHGHSGLTGFFVGSVAAAVAGHSKRTVLIAHRHN